VFVRDVVVTAFSATALLAFVGPSQLRTAAVAAADARPTLQSRTLPGTATGVDDALVLTAVIEHTILPEVRKSNAVRGRRTVVLVEDRSSPLCEESPGRGTPCRIPDQWQQFLAPDSARGWRGMIDNDRRREELVASLETRNGTARALPVIDHPSVVVIPVDRSEKAQRKFREQAGGVASLSLPGYSGDGHALVFGSYECGNVCGYSWLFVLERTDGVWRVQSAVMTSIS
jgi:hypothetical protein